jgi:hypothetical protein
MNIEFYEVPLWNLQAWMKISKIQKVLSDGTKGRRDS